jgi:protein-tyrosine phosphatase
MKKSKVSLLFVCLGNICRSPTAEAVFRKKVVDAKLNDRFFIDSAGTAGYHIGAAPDARAIDKGSQRGYDLTSITARKVSVDDYLDFDYIIAMDNQNLAYLNAHNTDSDSVRIQLMRQSSGVTTGGLDVPDPYYGGEQGFDEVLDILEISAQNLLNDIQLNDLTH